MEAEEDIALIFGRQVYEPGDNFIASRSVKTNSLILPTNPTISMPTVSSVNITAAPPTTMAATTDNTLTLATEFVQQREAEVQNDVSIIIHSLATEIHFIGCQIRGTPELNAIFTLVCTVLYFYLNLLPYTQCYAVIT